MRILGIDFGEKKLGLALSEGELARPLGVLNQENFESKIPKICHDHEVGKIVIGLSEGAMAEETKAFGQIVGEVTNLPVAYWEETLTSQEALRKMIEAGKSRTKRQREEHAIAAALILQAYLDNAV